MKFAWLTDVHLNFLEKEERILFYKAIVDTRTNGVLITGDIAEAPLLIDILKEMAAFVHMPIYFRQS